MSSPSMVFGVYAPQTSAGGSARLQAQLRTMAAGAGLLNGLCCRVHFIFLRGPDQRAVAAHSRSYLWLRRVRALGFDPWHHSKNPDTSWDTECFP